LLESHVQPTTPIYLLLRKTNGSNDLVAVTYIPSIAPVRSKTLFASTRATLVKELGIEGGTLFATESSEVLDPREWEERDKQDGAGIDEALLTREERELQGVKRAEDEERHGTKGRDLMGSEGRSGTPVGGSSVGVAMKMDDAGKGPLRELAQSGESEEGMVVQFVSFILSALPVPVCACALAEPVLMLRNQGYRPHHREPRGQLLRSKCGPLRPRVSNTLR
jgi:twinfilin